MTFKDKEGRPLAAILATPPRGTLQIAVLCHGFLSGKDSTTNKTLSRLLLDKEIATLRFDFFGHGESQGPLEGITVTIAVEQALAALEFVSFAGYTKIGLIGSSFGGLIALLAAARWHDQDPARLDRLRSVQPGKGIACLGLKCPVIDFPEELGLQLGEDGLAEWKSTNTIPDVTGKGTRIRLAYAFYEDAGRNIGYQAAPLIRAPTMIVQGDQDELVPLHQSRQFADGLKTEKSLRIVPGADHQFTKGEHFREMTALLADWLGNHLATTQS